MTKKGGAALQQELLNDEEWQAFLEKPGLVIVDVYNPWAGPCVAMVPVLKKIKSDLSSDVLLLAIASVEDISVLKRFSGECTPTWMFIVDGKMVRLVYGADAPYITQVILEEVKKYLAYIEGQDVYGENAIDPSELAPNEREKWETIRQKADEKIRVATAKRMQEILEYRTEVTHVVLSNHHKLGVLVALPMAKMNIRPVFADFWEGTGLGFGQVEKIRFTEDIIEELLYFADKEEEESFFFNEVDTENLLSEETMIFIVKPADIDGYQGNIDRDVLHLVYGEMMHPPGDPETPAALLTTKVVVKNEESQASEGSEGEEEGEREGSVEDVFVVEGGSQTSGSRESEEEEEEELVETYDVSGVWIPPNKNVRAMAIKLFFPRLYLPIMVPEPEPIPPHVAIVFDVTKKPEVFNLMNEYPKEVMRFGFFTTDNPDTANLIAKTLPRYVKSRAGYARGEKIVVQLSRKKSEALCAFAQLGPSFISFSPEEGEEDCKKFFPEDYDEEEIDDEGEPQDEISVLGDMPVEVDQEEEED